MNLEWLKKHKAVAIGGAFVALVIIYLIFRNSASSSSNSLGSAIASQNQGQLQMAQLNAQLSSQSEQTQAQLAAQEYETQASEQEEQDQTVGSLASEIIPDQLESNIYGQELTAQEQEQTQLLPLEETAQSQIGKGGSLEGTGADELALLLGEGSAATYPVYGQASTGSGLTLPSTINLGLFG